MTKFFERIIARKYVFIVSLFLYVLVFCVNGFFVNKDTFLSWLEKSSQCSHPVRPTEVIDISQSPAVLKNTFEVLVQVQKNHCSLIRPGSPVFPFPGFDDKDQIESVCFACRAQDVVYTHNFSWDALFSIIGAEDWTGHCLFFLCVFFAIFVCVVMFEFRDELSGFFSRRDIWLRLLRWTFSLDFFFKVFLLFGSVYFFLMIAEKLEWF